MLHQEAAPAEGREARGGVDMEAGGTVKADGGLVAAVHMQPQRRPAPPPACRSSTQSVTAGLPHLLPAATAPCQVGSWSADGTAVCSPTSLVIW